MSDQPVKNSAGRPRKYTEKLADEIVERMIHGEHIVQICNDESMPGRTSVYRWMDEYPEFGTRIARAREGLADHVAWKILEMADKSTNETANADRVKLAAWQWHAARLAPKKYSEKQLTEVSGPDGGAVKVESSSTIDIKSLGADQREVLKQILLSAQDGQK